MKVKFQVFKLVTIDDTFNPCIVIPFPSGGVIKDYFTAKNEGFILVQSDADAVMESAHFHAIGLEQITYTDSLEYVGLFKFNNLVEGYEVSVLPIVRILEGNFGSLSIDYIAEHGDIKPESNDLKPLTKEELYRLFNLDTPKRKYTKKRKDDPVG